VSDPHGEFRHEVEYLADRAAEERSRVAASSKPLLTHKPVRRFLWIGGLVALSQVLLFAYLTYEEQRQIAGEASRPNPLLFQQDCAGERYRTSRKLMVWMRQHGEAPETLDPLIGTLLEKVPVDPVTRQPLVYRKIGKGFELECP
jgi:hypothetical protein